MTWWKLRPGSRAAFTFAAVATFVLILTGCGRPYLSEARPEPAGKIQKTLTELRAQADQYISSALDAVDITDGWYRGIGSTGTARSWAATGGAAGMPPVECWTVGTKESEQLDVTLWHDPTGDSGVLAQTLSAHWRAEGFTVSTVVPLRPGTDRYTSIRADRDDGVNFGFTASDQIISLDMSTECSTHKTVLDYVYPDPFLTPSATPTS